VFRNDPGAVARAFAELLGPGGLYEHHFRSITFAVFDPGPDQFKVKAFETAFAHIPVTC